MKFKFLLFVILLSSISHALLINEVMYNPPNSDSYLEWIEIYNNKNYGINLSRWSLCGDRILPGYINHTDNKVYMNAIEVLPPAKYALITDGGSGTDVYDYFNVSSEALAFHVESSSLCGGLSNSGDTINLSNNSIELILSYKGSWGANGNGKTLEKIVANNDNSKNNWRESSLIYGTPGRENNIPPQVIKDINLKWPEDNNITVNLLDYFFDPDNDSLTFYVSEVNDLKFYIHDNQVTIVPNENFFGIKPLLFYASDGINITVINASLNITPVNDAPVIGLIENKTVIQDEELSFKITAHDIDDDNLTFTKDVEFGSLSSDGLFRWQPNSSYYGVYKIRFNVTDSIASDFEDVYINVFSTLNISKLVLKINNKTTDIKEVVDIYPGTELGLSLDVKNIGKIEIDRINISVSIGQLYTSISKDYLLPSQSFSPNLRLKVPPLIENGLYNLIIRAVGFDDSIEQKRRESNYSIRLNITSNLHDIIIEDISLEHSILKCLKKTKLRFNITNKGLMNETVNVIISNEDLRIYIENTTFVPRGNTIAQEYFISGLGKGIYYLTIKAKYHYYQEFSEKVKLVVEDCFIPDIKTLEDVKPKPLELYKYTSTSQYSGSIYNYSITQTNPELINCSLVLNQNISCNLPSANQSGYNEINLFVKYGNLNNSYRIRVVVEPVNDPPYFVNLPFITIKEDKNFTLNLTPYTKDIDNNEFTYIAKGEDIKCEIYNTLLYIYPPNNFNGEKVCYLVINDGINLSPQYRLVINVTPVNDPPQIISTPPAEATVNEEYVYVVEAIDYDNDSLTYSLVGPEGMVLENRTIKWVPELSDIKSHNVIIKVTDGLVETNQTFRLNVYPGLVIDDVKVDIDGKLSHIVENKTLNVKPGTGLNIKFKIRNKFRGRFIRNIFFNATIKELDLNAKGDIEELKPKESKELNLNVTIPLEIIDKKYLLYLKANGIDSLGNLIEASFRFFINIERKNHQIVISRFLVAPQQLRCNRSFNIDIEIINTGLAVEDISLNINNKDLGIDETMGFSLNKNEKRLINIKFDLGYVSSGIYELKATAKSDHVNVEAISKLNLEPCSLEFIPTENPIIPENISQLFKVILPTDFSLYSIKWYKNNTEVSNNLSYEYLPENKSGTYNYKIWVSIIGNLNFTHEWNLTVSSLPLTTQFDGETTNFAGLNESELENMSVILEKQHYGKIEFLEGMDMRNVVDLTNSVKFALGIIAIDTTRYRELNKRARITIRNLKYKTIPVIYYSDKFTTNPEEITELCNFCSLINYTSPPTSNGTVVFDVPHFSSYKVGVPPNRAPIADAGNDQEVIVNNMVILDGSLSYDLDNDYLSYKWIQMEGPLVKLANDTAPITTFTPSLTGTYKFKLIVNDSKLSSEDIVTINVIESFLGRVLDISRVKVIPMDPKPGDKVTVKVYIKNKGRVDIADIKLDVWFVDLSGNELEDEEGKEIKESSTFDLDAGEDESILSKDDHVFIFVMPYNVEDGDEYYVYVEAEGVQKNDSSIRYKDFDKSKKIRFRREKHDVIFYDTYLSPTTIKCEKIVKVNVGLRNIGKEDENIELEIKNAELGLNILDKLELEADPTGENWIEKTYTISIPDSEKGSYPILLKANYDNEFSEKVLNLRINECKTGSVVLKQFKERLTSPLKPEISVPETYISFRETSEYMILLLLAVITLSGFLIFLIGYLIIKGF